MTTSITLARDADTGHVILSHEQAAAVARVYATPDEATPHDRMVDWVFVDADTALEAFSRYILASAAERHRVAGVVAARAEVVTALDIDDRRVVRVREYRIRAEAAEAEVARLANELARYQTMTLHADHPSVVAAERDRLRDEVARLRAAMPPPSSLEAMAEWLAEGAPKSEIAAVQGRIHEWSARIRSALDAGADTTGADDER